MEDLVKEIKELKQAVIGELTETRDVVSKMNEKIDTLNVQKGESIDELYSTVEIIGSGSNATVYEVYNVENNTKYAMKVISMDKNRLTFKMANEISILYAIKHDNVVNLEEVYSFGNSLHLIMEYAGEDLNTYLQLQGTQNAEITKTWLKELLSALDFVHKRGVIHRDLKPENIMIGSDRKLKITDFGSVMSCFDNTNLYSEVATLPFRAPEILLGCDVYGKEIDMWAVGCIFAEMVVGEGLFGFKDKSDSELGILLEIFSKIGTPNPQSPLCSLPNFPKDVFQYPEASQIVPNLDALGNDLIKKMLVIDPLERITAEDALNHPYLKSTVSFSAFKPLLLVEASKVAEAIQFYKSVFGAEEVSCVTHPKRKADQELPLICAQLKLASTTFLISDHASDALNRTGLSFLLETEDFQAAIDRALNAGAVLVGEIAGGEGTGCGSRVGKVKDPYGVTWEITSLI